MATRSGLIYKKADTEETESAEMAETLKSMEKMLQQLMEDRRKREDEIARERAACDKETKTRVQEMQTQIDALMKLVSESQKAKAPAAAPLGQGPQVKLVPLTAQDDIESYLVTFERIMGAYKVPKEQYVDLLPGATADWQSSTGVCSTTVGRITNL